MEQGDNKSSNHIENKKKATKIIRYRTLMASGVGLIPFPFLDAAGILSIQLWMISDLAKIYNVPFKKNVAKSIIGTLLSNVSAVSILKLVPGINILGGGAMAISAGAATYALGKVFTQHFDQGGTLLSFDPVKSRAYFEQVYEESKVTVEELKTQEDSFKEVDTQALASVATLKKANADLLATIANLEKQLKNSKRDRALAVAAAKTQTKAQDIVEKAKKKGIRKWLGWIGRALLILIVIVLIIEGLYYFKVIDSFWDEKSSSDSTPTAVIEDKPSESNATISQPTEEPVPTVVDSVDNTIEGDTSTIGDATTPEPPPDTLNSSSNPPTLTDDGTSSDATQDTLSSSSEN